MNKPFYLLFLIVVLTGCDLSRPARKIDDPLKSLSLRGTWPSLLAVGEAPAVSRENIDVHVAPLYDYLEKKLQRPIHVRIAESYEDLVQLIATKSVYAASMPSLAYVTARKKYPIVAIAAAATGREHTYLGYLVVANTSHLRRLEDLRHKTIAWVNSLSTSGYLYPRALLRWRGIDPDIFFGRQYFAGNHQDVIRDVVEGRADVGATASSLVDQGVFQPIAAASEIRVVAKTQRIPMYCFVVHRSLNRQLARQIQKALLALEYDQPASRALRSSFGVGGFKAHDEAEYQDLERILDEERQFPPSTDFTNPATAEQTANN